jgi:hypothetical protein
MYLTDKDYEWYLDFMDEIVIKIKGTSDQIYLTRTDLLEMLYELDKNEDE